MEMPVLGNDGQKTTAEQYQGGNNSKKRATMVKKKERQYQGSLRAYTSGFLSSASTRTDSSNPHASNHIRGGGDCKAGQESV